MEQLRKLFVFVFFFLSSTLKYLKTTFGIFRNRLSYRFSAGKTISSLQIDNTWTVLSAGESTIKDPIGVYIVGHDGVQTSRQSDGKRRIRLGWIYNQLKFIQWKCNVFITFIQVVGVDNFNIKKTRKYLLFTYLRKNLRN